MIRVLVYVPAPIVSSTVAVAFITSEANKWTWVMWHFGVHSIGILGTQQIEKRDETKCQLFPFNSLMIFFLFSFYLFYYFFFFFSIHLVLLVVICVQRWTHCTFAATERTDFYSFLLPGLVRGSMCVHVRALVSVAIQFLAQKSLCESCDCDNECVAMSAKPFMMC